MLFVIFVLELLSLKAIEWSNVIKTFHDIFREMHTIRTAATTLQNLVLDFLYCSTPESFDVTNHFVDGGLCDFMFLPSFEEEFGGGLFDVVFYTAIQDHVVTFVTTKITPAI